MTDRITPGDVLPGIPSRTWNDTIAVRNRLKHSLVFSGNQRSAAPANPHANNVQLINTTGSTVTDGIFGISGPSFYPTATTDIKYAPPVLNGVTPDADNHPARIAVAVGPVANNAVTWAAIGGLVWTKVDVQDENHLFATVYDSDHFVSADSGYPFWPAATGTGIQDALVNLDVSGAVPALIQFAQINTASGYLDHNESGNVDFVTMDTCGVFAVTGRSVNACNTLQQRLWQGSIVAIVNTPSNTTTTADQSLNTLTIAQLDALTIAQLDVLKMLPEETEEDWDILEAYSAKHLSGLLAADLADTDATGTINNVNLVDGHYNIDSPGTAVTFNNWHNQSGSEGDPAVILWDDSSNTWLLLSLGKATESENKYRQYEFYRFLNNYAGNADNEINIGTNANMLKVEFDAGSGTAEGTLGIKQVTAAGDAYFECTEDGDYLITWQMNFWLDNQGPNYTITTTKFTETADGHRHSINNYLDPRLLSVVGDIVNDAPALAHLETVPLVTTSGDLNRRVSQAAIATLESGDQFTIRYGVGGAQPLEVPDFKAKFDGWVIFQRL